MLLIFAINFSGYPAAAHAFGVHTCNSDLKTEAVDTGKNVSNYGQQKDVDQNDSNGKSNTHDCCAAHCCVMKAMDKVDYKVPYHPMKENPLFIYKSVHSSDFLFGIFRPPRLAV